MGRPVRTRLRATTAVAVLGALLASGACTGGGDDDGKDKPRRVMQPKKLKKAWEARAVVDAAGADGGAAAWIGKGTLAVRDGDDLHGYDTSSGKQRWTLKAPEGTSGVCGMSDEPSKSGLGALFLTAQKKGDCSYAAAVDLADGEVEWAKDVGKMKGSYGKSDISIGDEALTVTLDCYGVKQFRAQDGTSLGTRLESDKACAHEVDHNGRHLAVREAPVGNAKEKVPGWIRAAEGAPAHFALYEGADKKPVWRTKAQRVGDELHGIVSDDPVVLDVSRASHRLIQTYDSAGKPVRTIGKQLKRFSSGSGSAKVGPFAQGDTLVMGYFRDPALYAYDLDTGKVRWKKRQDSGSVLGVWKDKLLAVRQVKGPKGLPVTWLMTYGIQDGEERTIGRIAEIGAQPQLFVGWDDDRIYLRRSGESGGSVVAYPLPDSGGDTRRYGAEPIPVAGDPPLKKHGWRKGDVRPDAAANACEAVSPTAQKSMRVYREGMPPPADCAWEERDAPRHAERELSVTVTAHQPGGEEESDSATPTGSRKPTPAVTVAKKAFRDAGRGKIENEDEDEKVLADAHPLDGLGDEAKSTANDSARGTWQSADLLARHRNVTVRVKARTEALSSGLWGEVPPQHRVEAAARTALADVLEQLGAEVPASERALAEPTGGKITEAKPLCSRLRSEAAGLVPGAKAQDTTPRGGADGRVTGCDWESDADPTPHLTVRVKALPDSPLTGRSAAKQAEEVVTSADGGELSGFGDEARLERDSFRHKANMNRNHTLVAREGNLVVYVDYQRWNHPTKSQLDADVKLVARRVLSAYGS
ncbi:PQQ enzyme repeat protein [Streptomyces sp. YIM 130001]|uniref:outer membrane protein assembly factor BamB family protein n=1 Tax=Streptomyces sp. YIM 130001 TaxID=2259644 RepID=UPI000E649A47|nr:PQQ-binding-like beta-propeller repeat protein [Streptomyces sp. YIM 130001]RII20401.1 PQQ enzyme repeat protein [Streptomyces sp. YIM 130001]